jgi:phosphatidylinositol alpha-1,6-mannosyltransferase
MQTLLITIEFPPETGGIENYSYNLIKRVSDSAVLAPKVPNSHSFDKNQNFKIIRKKILYHRQHWLFKNKFYSNSVGYLITLMALLWHSWRTIKKEKPDIVICSECVPVGIVIGLLNKVNNVPYVVFTHGKDILYLQHIPFVKWLIKYSFKKASTIVSNSEYTRNLVMELEVPKEKTKIIHPCVNSEQFRPINVSVMKKELDLSDKQILFSVGRLVKRKGNDMVIKSLPEVIEKIPDLVYLIAGNGPYKAELKKMVSDLDLEEHVYFLGYISDSKLPFYYNLCDVFIMPSRTEKGDPEGFGIVYIEASACCKPVIGSKMGGIPDAVIDGKTGKLVDPLDINDISHSIVELLSDKQKSKNMAQAGFLRARKELNWDRAAGILCEIIKNRLEQDQLKPNC